MYDYVSGVFGHDCVGVPGLFTHLPAALCRFYAFLLVFPRWNPMVFIQILS